MSVLALRLETAVWLLVALAEVPRVPALPWALADAVAHLAKAAPRGAFAGVAAELPAHPAGAEPRVGCALLALGSSGRLVPRGRGWEAGWEPAVGGRQRARALAAGLDAADRAAVLAAAQRLTAMTTIWSKNSRAAVESRASTS